MNSRVSSVSSGWVTRTATTRSPRESAAEIASWVSRLTPPTGTMARDRRGGGGGGGAPGDLAEPQPLPDPPVRPVHAGHDPDHEGHGHDDQPAALGELRHGD